MNVSYLGTTMLLFDDGKDQILFDCHVTRPSLRTCFRGVMDSDEKVAEQVIRDFDICKLRGIFISHSHHDHVLDAPTFAKKCDCMIYGSVSSLNVALGNGVGREKLCSYEEKTEMQIGAFRIRVIPSLHSKPHWYNNDVGLTIDEPLSLPAPKKAFKEGGSVDFLVTHPEGTYLIRPSYNYLEGQLEGITADVLFLGIGGMSRDGKQNRARFFAETVDKVHPGTVVPIHWDNFFIPLYGSVRGIPAKRQQNCKSVRILKKHCAEKGIVCLIQLPLTSLDLSH